MDIDGVKVNVIDLESFKKNKRAVGSHQDLADLENLELQSQSWNRKERYP